MSSLSKLLVVDDYLPIRKTLGDLLGASKYDVVSVGTGREAIDMVKKEDFSVAIIDDSLPDINGMVVMKTIKQIKPGVNCLMTTTSTETDRQDFLKEGASDFFIKPIDLDRMMCVIKGF